LKPRSPVVHRFERRLALDDELEAIPCELRDSIVIPSNGFGEAGEPGKERVQRQQEAVKRWVENDKKGGENAKKLTTKIGRPNYEKS
jgi:hypothetical protein